MNSQTIDHDPNYRHAKHHQTWSRLLYMLVFWVLLNIAGAVMCALTALQFLFVLSSGEDNRQLRSFARSIAKFVQQALLFVSFNTEQKPFPFSDWPLEKSPRGNSDVDSSEESASHSEKSKPDDIKSW